MFISVRLFVRVVQVCLEISLALLILLEHTSSDC